MVTHWTGKNHRKPGRQARLWNRRNDIDYALARENNATFVDHEPVPMIQGKKPAGRLFREGMRREPKATTAGEIFRIT